MSVRRLAACAIVLLLAVAASASGGPKGQWSRLPGTVINFAEPGLARTGDGVLHVVYVRRVAPSRDDLMHTVVMPTGRVGQTTVALGGWQSMNHPDALRMPDGTLRVFFGGIRAVRTGEQNTSLNTATAPARGVPWTLQEGRASQSVTAYSSATAGAGLARDGTPISSWATTAGIGFHYGVDPNVPDRAIPAKNCCLYAPEIAVDAKSGQTYIGFFSLERGAEGVYVQAISPAGAQGKRWLAPGVRVGASAVNPGARTALTARIGAPGVFLAHGQGYPTYKTVTLSRVGRSRPQIAIKAAGADHVNVAAAPQGRLWLMWEQDGTIYAARTNTGATKLGAVNTLRPPGGGAIFRLSGEGSAGPLDLVANVSSGGQALWHQQILPKLTLLGRRSGTAIVLRVLDAGEPVARARVTAGGKKLTTTANGTARLTKAPTGRVKASASKAGYTAATTTVR